MKKAVIGILAHVDAGKTTLSEGLLYLSGSIRKFGRVDHQDAFLDNFSLERQRGITIFSKQAVLTLGDLEVTLLDTPGHVDFSAEMERTLQVLDYAVLVVSGTDGVQAHTLTLWRLLERYQIPVFLFINKMDLPGADADVRMAELRRRLSEGCLAFDRMDDAFYEAAALTEESAMDEYLTDGALSEETLRGLIAGQRIFPCYFGSALRLSGVEELIAGLERWIQPAVWPASSAPRSIKSPGIPRGHGSPISRSPAACCGSGICSPAAVPAAAAPGRKKPTSCASIPAENIPQSTKFRQAEYALSPA